MSEKKSLTRIDAAQIESICRDAGAHLVALSGFVQISFFPGAKRPPFRLYVPKTKTVSRMDVAGFSPATPGVDALGDASFGSVTHQVDFSHPAEIVLENIALLVAEMKGLPAPSSPAPRQSKKSRDEGAVGWSQDIPVATKESRRALIEKVAREKGVEVSPSAPVA